MAKIIMSAFADEYSPALEEQLKGMQGFGIGYVELRQLDGKNVSALTETEAREAKRMLDAYGIGVSAIGSPLGKIKLDGDLDGHMETAKRVCETANIVGARYVRMFSFYAPDGKSILDMKDEVIDNLGRMVDIAETAGVTLCHENEAKIYGDVPERCREIIDCFDGKLKCVFDMGNFVLDSYKPYPDAYELLREYIEYFHIKDSLYAGAIVPAGCGEATIYEILKAHSEYAKGDFVITLEPHLQTFSGLNALVGKGFDNPYKFESTEAAFTEAVRCIKGIVEKI